MKAYFRLTAAALATAWLATGCGMAAPQPTMARAAAAASASSASLVRAYQAIAGYDDRALAERLRLIEALGSSGSDEAAELLVAEYGRLGSVPPAAAAQLEGPLLDGMAALAADIPVEMRAKKRFNLWKELDKALGRKKRKKRKKRGGGGAPPAPPAEEPML